MSYFAPAKNTISTTSFNSRAAATLAAGAVFQGVSEEVSQYGRAGIAVFADNATDGILTIETSIDNVTWSGPARDIANTAIAAPHMWNIVEKYFRIKYTNGTTEATNLAIQVQYSVNADILLAHELDETLPAETESLVVRPATDFDLDAARKHITGQRSSFIVGSNPVVTTAFEDIYPVGGNINWQTAATKVEVVSTNAADNGTTPGLGLLSVEVHGLSATGADQDEVILTNGTTAVESLLDYVRVNAMHNEEVGTYGGSHRGNITCQVTGGGAALSRMVGLEGSVDSSVQYGIGEAGNGFYTVPLGKVVYLTALTVSVDGKANVTADVVLYEREGILTTSTPFLPRRMIWDVEAVQGYHVKEFHSFIKIKALTDIFFRAQTNSGTAAIDVTLDFYIVDENADGA